MQVDDVLVVVGVLRQAGLDFWLDGGWGIDALLGAQHRAHDDLDLVVPLADVESVCSALAPHRYRLTEDCLPTRAVIRDGDGRQVDLHPITFDESGRGWQAKAMPNGDDCEYPPDGFTTGSIGGVAVGCLSAGLQLAHHLGYEPRPHDRADMVRLAERFALQLPASLTNRIHDHPTT